MTRSNRKPGETYTGRELKASRLTKLIQAFPSGVAIYSHTVKHMAGAYVTIWPSGNWETTERFVDAKRAAVYAVL